MALRSAYVGGVDEEDRPRLALLRISVLGPPVGSRFEHGELEELCRATAARTWVLPGAGVTEVSARTSEDWFHVCQRAGFAALQSKRRSETDSLFVVDPGVQYVMSRAHDRLTALKLIAPLAVLLVVGCSGGGGLSGGWSGRAAQIAMANRNACALQDDGQVYCWGDGEALLRGLINTGENLICTDPFIPTGINACVTPVARRVATDLRFVEITGKGNSLCGRTKEGAVYCWPEVDPGCKGDWSTCAKALENSGGIVFASISGSERGFCGVAVDGRGYCEQVLGQGPSLPPAAQPPVELPGGHRFVRIDGSTRWAGIDTDGLIWEGDSAATQAPVQIGTLSHVKRVSEGEFVNGSGCAIGADGIVSCWGSNLWGGLGDDSVQKTYRAAPAPIAGGVAYKEIATTGSHACGITEAGAVNCWGWNPKGQIGAPATGTCPDPRAVGTVWPCTFHPTPVALPAAAVAVLTQGSSTCVLLADQHVWCWGDNEFGQVGCGSLKCASNIPQRVVGE